MNLRELDARIVPRAAAGLRALLDGVADGRMAATERLARSRLGRLDDRFATRGPLRLLRDVPQLGLLVAALLLLSGTGLALSQRDDRTDPTVARAPSVGLVLGPPVGTDAEAHLAEAAGLLRDLDPTARHLALVSLRSALTPEQTGALLERAGLGLERAYLRAEVPGRPEQIVFQTPGDVVAGLQQVFSATAVRKADEQRDLLATAAALDGASGPELEIKAQYQQDAGTAGAEAAAYRAGCACVFALLVNAEAQSLVELLDMPEVRGVEAAPRGAAVAALSVRPLRPAETGTVDGDAS